jgi:preprotein translocase subunit SecA
VDRQLSGRAARQGDPGSVQIFVSAEDELLRKYLAAPLRKSLTRAGKNRWLGRERAAKFLVKRAQKKAQSLAFKQRRNVMRSDAWLDQALSFAGADTI